MTELSTLEATGYSYYITAASPILQRNETCQRPQPSSNICGEYILPCYRTTNGDAVKGVFVASNETSAYYQNATIYTEGSGCANQTMKYLEYEAQGYYSIHGKSKDVVVSNGLNIELRPEYWSLIPRSMQAVSDLNDNCTCNGSWSLNTRRNLTAICTECTALPFLHQPVGSGEPTYAISQHFGINLRFTNASTNAITAYTTMLSSSNVQYVLASDNCSIVFPDNGRPVIPGPSPAVSKPGKKISGGDVFIIILFVFGFVYFVGGMLINYQRTGGSSGGGTPVIPHVSFWRSLPGLITDGCAFTFAQRCGTRRASGGPTYSSFGGPSESTKIEGYGSL
eukprot:m.1385125 g.1385125  ORF g.1385125 m.1385125 type:complete len:338 (-) comp24975_c1_seq36:3083-4096(-)